MTDGERAAAETAAYITAASMKHPATSRDHADCEAGWQGMAAHCGPAEQRAATMNEQQLGRALIGARDEQQRAALLQDEAAYLWGRPGQCGCGNKRRLRPMESNSCTASRIWNRALSFMSE